MEDRRDRPTTYDRRSFLSRGMATAAGLSVLGGAGSVLLDACSSGSSTASPGSAAGNTSGISSAAPKPGGAVTMGLESEVNSFNPTKGRFDPGGIMYARTVFDPLAAYASDGTVHGYLAQSITPNADYTQWTITMRPNIMFHDGTPCDAGAVKTNLDGVRASGLTGPALTNIADTRVTGPLTVVVDMHEAWVPFPSYMTGQVGFVAAPSMLNAPGGGGDHPIGTGPFVFKEWVQNDHFTATKNPSYWRQGLPYLDQVTYRPIPDTQAIDNSLLAGTLDLIHSSDPDTIVAVRGNASFDYLTDANVTVGEPSQDFIMLNTAAAPLDDVRVRQALAYATNKQKIIDVTYDGLVKPSNGPFPPGNRWFSDTGYPQYDVSKAQQLVNEVKRDKGTISFQLGTTNSSKNLQRVQLVQAMWQQVGIQTTIDQVEQTQFIANALVGKYQAYTWRQFDAPDPDGNYVWWSVETAAPIGSSALNFARNKDPQIQAALQTGRTQSSPAARTQAYKTVAQRFGVDIPYLWVNQTLWTIAANKKVQNFNGATLPDGARALPMTGGYFFMDQTWVNR